MGKLFDRLQKQLLITEHKEDAENCLKIYNYLKEKTGNVWESEWRILVNTTFKGFPSNERTFKPTSIGNALLNGINFMKQNNKGSFIDHKPIDEKSKCNSPEHNPPSHIVLEAGQHTYQCPQCGNITVVNIPNITV